MPFCSSFYFWVVSNGLFTLISSLFEWCIQKEFMYWPTHYYFWSAENYIFTACVLKQFLIPLQNCVQLTSPVIYFAYLCAGKWDTCHVVGYAQLSLLCFVCTVIDLIDTVHCDCEASTVIRCCSDIGHTCVEHTRFI